MIQRIIEKQRRTAQQKEIDYIEEQNGQISAYEFKWNKDAKAKTPLQFLNAYPDATFTVIHRDNVEDFLLQNISEEH